MERNRGINHRLDSWKEIADYLKRDIRTAIRWEKERGLPVHRVPGGQRQTVFAYTSEIDSWLSEPAVPAIPSNTVDERDRKTNDPSKDDPVVKVAGGPDHAAVIHSPAHRRLRLLAMGSTVCICAITIFWRLTIQTNGSIQPLRFIQLTDDGRAKMNLRTDGKSLYFNEIEGTRLIVASLILGTDSVRKIYTPFANVELQDVSKDGQGLLVLSFEGTETERPLWNVPVHGGSPGRVGNLYCRSARWSPDNQFVACVSGTGIIISDSYGSHGRTVASLPSPAGYLEWSPDNSTLRFAIQNGVSGIWSPWQIDIRKTSDVQPPVKLAFSGNCCTAWGWTPNQEYFLYSKAGATGETTLVIRPQKGGFFYRKDREYELPVKVGNLSGFVPGQSGNSLYLVMDGPWRIELLQFRPEQKAFEALLPGVSGIYLSFSPDGKWMTYINTLDQSLWRSRADGSNAILLSKGFLYTQMSSWSPDGRKIAFMGKKAGKPWRIYLIDRDGGEAVEAVPGGNDNQGAPTWSPDGSKLAYGNVVCDETQTCWIWILDLLTGTAEKIPGSHSFRTARWSPDGNHISALVPDTHELMLFDFKTRHWKILADGITGDNMSWSGDSQYIYADSPQGERPLIERICVNNGKREMVVGLASLQKVPGQIDFWFGLSPENRLILAHRLTSSEIYSLDWTIPK